MFQASFLAVLDELAVVGTVVTPHLEVLRLRIPLTDPREVLLHERIKNTPTTVGTGAARCHIETL